MNYILFCQVKQPFKNVSDDRLGCLLSQMTPFSKFRLQISLITELSYDVAISIAGKYFKASQNVGVI